MKIFKIILKTLFISLCFVAIVIGAIALYNHIVYGDKISDGHKVVVCIPVYGQSLALGEQAELVTNFDKMVTQANGRILSEYLDYAFGFYDAKHIDKQGWKKFLHYRARSYELSIYGMSESLVSKLDEDTVICIFPSGAGMSAIDVINKPCLEYSKFISEMRSAYKKAKNRGWDFYVPAICWMQGESDIIDYTTYDYQSLLKQFQQDVENDIKAITQQKNSIPLICYQSNVLTMAKKFSPLNYNCIETRVAQSFVNLIKNDSLFWASGPTYPYNFVGEALHIDGFGQKQVGNLAAISALRIIRGENKFRGLIPLEISTDGNNAVIHMNVPAPPLKIDTVKVKYIKNYGFSVITKEGKDIAESISIKGDSVIIACSQSPTGCKVRYAVNGEKMKSGYEHGPRGNLRDSQGDTKVITIKEKEYPLYNWCYQFDLPCTPNK